MRHQYLTALKILLVTAAILGVMFASKFQHPQHTRFPW